MAATKSRKKAFNWTGITDNGDGTFNAEGKREKTRLLKEFHRQGVAVQSKKIAGDGYVVSSIGSIAKPRLGPRPSLRPRTIPQRRINRPMYRGIPRVRPMRALPPNYRAPPQVARRNPPIGSPQSKFTSGGPPKIPGQPGAIRQWLHHRAQAKQQPITPHYQRVKESQDIEADLRRRSLGQPSTRVPFPKTNEEIVESHMEQRRIRQEARTQQIEREKINREYSASIKHDITPRQEPMPMRPDESVLANARNNNVSGE